MNLDLSSTVEFGNETALQTFFLDHRVVHEQEAQALQNQFGGAFSTFGIGSQTAEEAWLRMMREREGPTPQSLVDWLSFHAAIHVTTYQAIGGSGTTAPDLSQADFSRPDSFYSWMFVHQQMHDFEQAALGLS